MHTEVVFTNSQGITRDEEFWYPDGSIVLVARGRAFKIYHGLLAQYSEIFQDLLSVPQPESAETIDGRPLVHLTDSPEDLRYMLRFVFQRKYFPSDHGIEFDACAALIRLGHKYQFDDVQREGVRQLKLFFPEDYASWMKMYTYGLGSPEIRCSPQETIRAVNLARLVGAETVLPAALYACCQLDSPDLVNGYVGPDGIIERLSLEDLVRCIDGAKALQTAVAGIVYRVCRLDDVPDFSQWNRDIRRHHQACWHVVKSLERDAHGEKSITPDVFWVCVEMMADDAGSHLKACCNTCLAFVRAKGQQELRQLWNRLPSFFDLKLDNWDIAN